MADTLNPPFTVYKSFGDAMGRMMGTVLIVVVILSPAELIRETARDSLEQLGFGTEANDTALLSMSSAHAFNTRSLCLGIASEQIEEDVHGMYRRYSGSKCLLTNHINLIPPS